MTILEATIANNKSKKFKITTHKSLKSINKGTWYNNYLLLEEWEIQPKSNDFDKESNT